MKVVFLRLNLTSPVGLNFSLLILGNMSGVSVKEMWTFRRMLSGVESLQKLQASCGLLELKCVESQCDWCCTPLAIVAIAMV
ncbi:hypothetical protein VNO77_21726 [Canavalia gladiata]|uniref:Uncharacterized protein n=1 Tax=Canavalia gladiata TaxID=3824 RepID=A0AAN9L1I3_CANGL